MAESVLKKGKEALSQYQADIHETVVAEPDVLHVDLADGRKYFNLYVFSDLYLGSPLNMPRLNKLMADIEQAEQDENAIVILGGNLFYYEAKKSKFNTVEKTNMAYALFEGLKDKIVAVVNGPFEDQFAKRDVHPARSLAKKLGVLDKYRPNGADIVVTLKNDYTDGTEQKVTIYVVGLKTKANTFAAIGNLADKTAIQHGIADINIFTCVNKSFAPRRVVQRDSGNVDHIELAPYYLIGNSGYKNYVNLPNNKLIEPNYTGNKIYHVVVGKNYDYTPSNPKKTITRPKYKIYLERHGFGEEIATQAEVELTDELAKIKKKNSTLAKILKTVIDEVLQEKTEQAEAVIESKKRDIRTDRKNSTKKSEANHARIAPSETDTTIDGDDDDDEIKNEDFEDEILSD